jgi:hypothetical protein
MVNGMLSVPPLVTKATLFHCFLVLSLAQTGQTAASLAAANDRFS